MEFEWDDEKNKKNIEKHGIDYADAALVFDSPILEQEDSRTEYGETRLFAIGMVNEIEISIVYTKRKNKIRFISARRARRDERKKYRSVYEEHSSKG